MSEGKQLSIRSGAVKIGQRYHTIHSADVVFADGTLKIVGRTGHYDSYQWKDLPGARCEIDLPLDAAGMIKALFNSLTVERRALLHRQLHDEIFLSLPSTSASKKDK